MDVYVNYGGGGEEGEEGEEGGGGDVDVGETVGGERFSWSKSRKVETQTQKYDLSWFAFASR